MCDIRYIPTTLQKYREAERTVRGDRRCRAFLGEPTHSNDLLPRVSTGGGGTGAGEWDNGRVGREGDKDEN